MQLSLFSESSNSPPPPQTVTEITRHIHQLFDQNATLQAVAIEGEISNFTRASSGHFYFSLKDENAQLRCVMWRSSATKVAFRPKQGDKVIASGRISVYDAQGAYQLYVDRMEPVGAGDLHREFERLKAKLDAEGLFDPERKKPLPVFPRKIGVVSSPTAAGFQDMLNIWRRRYPSVEIILSPSLVQGKGAPPAIIRALEKLHRYGDIDLIILARGGGSLEDLWCFNHEDVVRAVANSHYPTISGVGHEIDFTLIDFAADYRAPTPSAAAEVSTPHIDDLLQGLQDVEDRITRASNDHLSRTRRDLQTIWQQFGYLNPSRATEAFRDTLRQNIQQASYAIRSKIQAQRAEVNLLEERLRAMNPQTILERGYARISHDGKTVSSIEQVKSGDELILQLKDGRLNTTINRKDEQSIGEVDER